MTAAEYKNKLEARTGHFAVSVFRMAERLPHFVFARTIAGQLGKAAISIAEDFKAASRAGSAYDFDSKITAALNGCSEAKYWLGVLAELYPANRMIMFLNAENKELIKLLSHFQRTYVFPAYLQYATAHACGANTEHAETRRHGGF